MIHPLLPWRTGALPARSFLTPRRAAPRLRRLTSSTTDFVDRYWATKTYARPPEQGPRGLELLRQWYRIGPAAHGPEKHRMKPVALDVLEAKGLIRITLERERTTDPVIYDFNLLWLRDLCSCPTCVDPHSGQKNFSTTQLADRPRLRSVDIHEDHHALEVVWEDDPLSGGGLHRSCWSADVWKGWHDEQLTGYSNLVNRQEAWDRSAFEALLPRTVCDYGAWTDGKEGFSDALAMLALTGLVFVTGVPPRPDAVERVAAAIGPLLNTFYGLTWDVRSKPEAENVAYTSRFLGLHQDLLYMTRPPRLQFLHCHENSCEGGESLFSDGLRATFELRLRLHPKDFHMLRTGLVEFHYDKGGHHYRQSWRVIQPFYEKYIQPYVSWAPPFQAPFPATIRGVPVPIEAWKTAATAFESSISAPENMVQVRLEPGDCAVFDNRRILHGRRQFDTAVGSRWLKGCYVDEDAYRSALARLDVPPGPSKRCGFLGEARAYDMQRRRRQAGLAT